MSEVGEGGERKGGEGGGVGERRGRGGQNTEEGRGRAEHQAGRCQSISLPGEVG